MKINSTTTNYQSLIYYATHISWERISYVERQELIKELTIFKEKEGNHAIFSYLYIEIAETEDKITEAEEESIESVETNRKLIICYYSFGKALSESLTYYKRFTRNHEAQILVTDEVWQQISKHASNNAFPKVTDKKLRIRMEIARKIYSLFRGIGEDKIQYVKSFSVISKLNWDDIDIILLNVLKKINRNE